MKAKRIPALGLAVVIVLAAAVWYTFYNLTFVALSYNDAMDYASMARNVARGEGFISSYITPLGLAHQGLPHPDLWRAPAWPAILAVFIKVMGATDQAVALASGFFYLAAAPLIFLLARYWFGPVVAAVSVAIYVFSAQNLHFSISGLTEPMALFMLVLVVYLLTMPGFRNRWGDMALGLAAGVFYLARYNALLFVPVIAIYWWQLRRPAGFAAVARYGTAFLLTVLPWLWRNYSLMGSPLFSLQKYEPVMFTKTYPGYSLYMMLEKVDVPGFLRTHQAELWLKVQENWRDFLGHLFDPGFTGVSAVLFGLFLLAVIMPFNERQRGVRPFLLTCFGLQLLALMIIHYIPRLFFMFMPFYVIYGMAAVVSALPVITRKVTAVLPVKPRKVMPARPPKTWSRVLAALIMPVLGAYMIWDNLPSFRQPNVRAPLIKEYAGSIREVMFRAGRGDLILSNDGHILAWYGDRYAAKLPYSTDLLPELEKLAPVKMVYLSGRMNWNIPEADESWRQLYWSKFPQLYDFRLLKQYPDGSLIYVRD